ncbi:Proteophosphoglycan 5 [Rhodotorula toruloides]|nr:Proteophosphoglycan 5 [Rhodotorula toruloides]
MSNAPAAPASLPSSSRQRSFLAAVSAAPFSNLVPVSDSASNSRTIDSYTTARLPPRRVTTLTVGEGQPARVLRRKASVTVRGRYGGAGGGTDASMALPSRRSVSRDRPRPSLSADRRAELPPSPAYPSRPSRAGTSLNTTTPLAPPLPTLASVMASMSSESASSAAKTSTSSRPHLSRPGSSRSALTDSSSPSDSDSNKSAFRSGMLKLKKSTASLRAALRSSSHKHEKAPPLPLQIPSSSSTSSFGEENLVTPPLPTAKPPQPPADSLDSRQPPTSPTTPRRSRTRPRTSQQPTANVSQDRSTRHCSRTLRRAASTSQIGRRLPVLPDARPPSPPPLPRAARTQ